MSEKISLYPDITVSMILFTIPFFNKKFLLILICSI